MGKRLLALIVLVVAVVALTAVALVALNDNGGDEDGVVSDIRESLGLDSDESTITGSGYLEGTRVTVPSMTGGQVQRVLVNTGDEVGRDDVLVELADGTLSAQLRQAEAGLASARAGLERVNAGARPEQIRALETAVTRADLAVDGSRRELEGATAGRPRAVVDALQTGYEVALAALQLAEAELALAKAGPAPSYVLAAEAAVRGAEVARDSVALQVERLTVRSPITGTVTAVAVKPGESVAQGASVVHVAQLNPLQLVIYVPGESLNDLAPGQKVTIDVDSHDDSFDGEVVAISDEAEFTPRNVQTKDDRKSLVYAVFIHVPNEDNDLKPGMPADASIEVD